MKRIRLFIIVMVLALLIQGCSANPVSATSPPILSSAATPIETESPSPAAATPAPTATPEAASTPTATPNPTPTATPAPAVYQFTYNPYVVTPDILSYLGKAGYEDYKKLVDAVLARKESVPFKNKKTAADLYSCLMNQLPLCRLVKDISKDNKKSALIISYNYQVDEHQQMIDQFTERIQTIMESQLKPEYNDAEKALVLYRYISQFVTYIDEGDVSPYNALMNGKGICQSYAGAYEFLLGQCGIPCLSASGFTTDKNAHAWSFVKLGKKYYHMDPTFEDSTTQGNGLNYFGMTDQRRIDSGAVKPFGIGCDSWFQKKGPACSSDIMNELQYVISWELVPGKHEVILAESTGNTYVLNTETLEIVPQQ